MIKSLEAFLRPGNVVHQMCIVIRQLYLNQIIHQAVIAHKRQIHQYIVKLATDAGVGEPQELACQLYMLIEGSVVSAQISGECSTKSARSAAELLIDHALSAPSSLA